MIDFLGFSRYVDDILQAYQNGCLHEEEELGRHASAYYDFWLVPGEGEPQEDITFAWTILSESRKTLDGYEKLPGYLISINKQCAELIKTIDAYLEQRKPKAPRGARLYMNDCKTSACFFMDETFKILQKYYPDYKEKAHESPDPEKVLQADANGKAKGRGLYHLFKINKGVRAESLDYIDRNLIEYGIIENVGNATDRQRLLRAFLFGLSPEDAKQIREQKMQCLQATTNVNLVVFVDSLINAVTPDVFEGRQNKTIARWFVDSQGEPINPNSLTSTLSQYKKGNKDKTEIERLAKGIAKKYILQ